MLKKIINILIQIQIFIFILNSDLFGIVTIKPDHPNFQYTGRIDFSIPDKPIMYWPGTYIKANFEGSLLIIMLDDQTGQSYYNVFIDEDYDNPHVIDCTIGSHPYLISSTLKDTVHSLLIFRRTEASTGLTKFLGIILNDGKTIVEPPARPKHKILFYGNSITCGLGNEAPDNIDFGDEVYNNNFMAYGAITSRLLDADYMCIAKSGIGIMISWFPMVMSDYFYRLDPDNPDSYWNFNEYIPDVVVINLFQNDSWLIKNLDPVPDSSQIVNAYVDFVRTIRSHHPNAFIVCSLGSMDATRAGSPWPGYISKAVEYMKTVDNDSSIGTLFFPYDPSWTKHPRVRHHQAMGQKLAEFIRNELGWVTGIKTNYFEQFPHSFNLFQNYPNPFNPSTEISFSIPQDSHVKLELFNILGEKVATLIDKEMSAGAHNYQLSIASYQLPSGIYFYQLRTGDFSETKKMILMK